MNPHDYEMYLHDKANDAEKASQRCGEKMKKIGKVLEEYKDLDEHGHGFKNYELSFYLEVIIKILETGEFNSKPLYREEW